MRGREQGGWTASRAFRSIAARFRDGCDGLPATVWHRWLATHALGFVILVLLTAGLVQAGKYLLAAGLLDWEAEFLRRLEAEVPLSFSSAVWVQTLGTDITLIFVVLFTAGAAAWAGRPFRALTILAAYLSTDLIVRLGWMMWDRPRPQVILEGIAAPGFASFPSGHTAKAVAVYGILAFLWARSSDRRAERLLALTLATIFIALVMYGRLRMGVHWPSDVLAGALIGAAWLGFLIVALRRAERAVEQGAACSASSAAPLRRRREG